MNTSAHWKGLVVWSFLGLLRLWINEQKNDCEEQCCFMQMKHSWLLVLLDLSARLTTHPSTTAGDGLKPFNFDLVVQPGNQIMTSVVLKHTEGTHSPCSDGGGLLSCVRETTTTSEREAPTSHASWCICRGGRSLRFIIHSDEAAASGEN